jgi:DNA primase
MSRGFVSSELKDEIRRRIDAVALISAHASLKKAGRYYKGLCPFHQEKTPSFHVDPERGLFHCFGCGRGGDIFDFLMQTANLSFLEAAEELARRAGVPFDVSPQAAQRASEREQLMRALDAARGYFRAGLRAGKSAQAYLARRGVRADIAERFQLGYAPAGWDGLLSALGTRGYPAALLEQAGLVGARSGGTGYFDIFRDRLMFPILDLQDRPVAFGGRALDGSEPSYLNSRETPVFAKGRTLYGLNLAREAIRDAGEALVVEGYMDVLAAAQFGFRHAVASLGTALSADQVALLRRFAPRVVLIYDSDRAGELATERGLTLFEEAEVAARVAVLPAGEDPDDFLRRRGPEAFARALDAALPMFEYRVAQAVRRHDPKTREGKISLADEVLTVIQTVANPVRKAEYVRALAERFDLSEEALRQRMRARQRSGRAAEASQGTVTPGGDRARERAERLLLHVMVQEPGRRTEMGRRLSADSFGIPSHQKLARALFAAPDAAPETLRERLDDETAGLLMRFVFEEAPVTDRDRDRAVQDALRYLTHTEPAEIERRRLWEAIQAAQAKGDHPEVSRLQAMYADLIVAAKRGG